MWVVGVGGITEGARWGWGGGYPTHLRLCNTLIGHLFEKFALANRTPCFGELTLVARDNRAAAAICRRACADAQSIPAAGRPGLARRSA